IGARPKGMDMDDRGKEMPMLNTYVALWGGRRTPGGRLVSALGSGPVTGFLYVEAVAQGKTGFTGNNPVTWEAEWGAVHILTPIKRGTSSRGALGCVRGEDVDYAVWAPPVKPLPAATLRVEVLCCTKIGSVHAGRVPVTGATLRNHRKNTLPVNFGRVPVTGTRPIVTAGYASKQRRLCIQKGKGPDIVTLPKTPGCLLFIKEQNDDDNVQQCS